ncbi:MAG: hypothetical protein Q7T89_10670, partial [Anaerolineales bacterium]|nr:hypothetical protein [Anaerolineales bacterium]
MVTEYSVTTGCCQETKFHLPLFGNEFWKVTVASVPKAAGDNNRKRPSAVNYRPRDAAIRYAKAILQRFRRFPVAR